MCFSQMCKDTLIHINNLDLTFNSTRYGGISMVNEFCLQEDGTPISLKCININENQNQQPLYQWSPLQGTCVYHYLIRNERNDFTRRLSNLRFLRSESQLNEQLAAISSEVNKFKPVDVNILSDIFCNRQISADCSVQTLSNIIEVPETIITDCQKSFNSTDRLLDGFDQQLERYVGEESVTVAHANVIVKSFNIRTTNIRGVSVNKDLVATPIYRNETLDKIITKNVILAVYLTEDLLKQIEETIPQYKNAIVVVTIFLKDILFNEEQHRSTQGQVLSVVIPEFKAQFKSPIRLLYRKSNVQMDTVCSHWMYGNSIKGSWHPDSESSLVDNVCSDYSICEYWHVTHFGMLILGNIDDIKTHARSLEIVTIMGTGVSLFGLALIFLTAVIYRKWTKQPGTLILLNFSLAIAVQLIVFYLASIFRWGNDSCGECIAVGGILHYAVLAGFTWMLVLSYLNYRRYVIVLVGAPPKYLVLKSCIFAWLLPILPVLIVALVDSDSYARNSKFAICYPSGAGFYAGVLTPLCIILIINTIVFLLIAKNIFSPSLSEVPRMHSTNLGMLKIRLLVLLFFALGLTWIFGILANVTQGLILVYLFCATATLQGFIVFLFFIVFNEDVRSHYLNIIRSRTKGDITSRRETETTGETSLNK